MLDILLPYLINSAVSNKNTKSFNKLLLEIKIEAIKKRRSVQFRKDKVVEIGGRNIPFTQH